MSNQKRKNCRPRRVRRAQHDRQKRAAAARKEHAKQVRRARISILQRLDILERRADRANAITEQLESWCRLNGQMSIATSSAVLDDSNRTRRTCTDLRFQTRLLWLFVVALWLAFSARELFS